MYTYLNQRYGLKQLIIEWASSIINGIKRYSKEDADVCLFGKILRNEVDEEFRFLQFALNQAVFNHLRQLIREKHSLKGEVELKAIADDIINDKAPIENAFWTKIIERMYNEEDIAVLDGRIRENAQNKLRLETSRKI